MQFFKSTILIALGFIMYTSASVLHPARASQCGQSGDECSPTAGKDCCEGLICYNIVGAVGFVSIISRIYSNDQYLPAASKCEETN
jgi:hypothetical protein